MAEISELLFAAIEKSEKAEVARLLKEGANPNAKDAQSRAALMLAATKGESDIIKTLLSGMRPYLETTHYNAAKNALVRAKGLERTNEEEPIRKEATDTVIVFSALCLEAFINRQYAVDFRTFSRVRSTSSSLFP